MSRQTKMKTNHAIGYAGDVDSQRGMADIVSKFVETSGGADFGVAVSRGTKGGVVVGGTDFFGIMVRDYVREGDLLDKVKVTKGAVLRSGYIRAIAAVSVDDGDKVTFDETTGLLSNTGGTDITGASWEGAVVAGQVGLVRLV